MLQSYDVVIVGGGYAGLSVLHRLKTYRTDLSILVLEARERFGGRTCTNSVSVDVGGQWVGPQHSEMLTLLNEFGLSIEDQIFSVCGDRNRLVELCNYQLPSLTPIATEQVVAFRLFLDDLITRLNNKELSTLEAVSFDAESVEVVINRQISSEEAKNEVRLFVQTVVACATFECSFLFFLFYAASGGGMEALGDGENGAQKWKIVGGAQEIPNRIAQRYPENIRLNTVVTSITEHPNHTIVSYKEERNSGLAFSTCAARHVVFAISPVLVRKLTFFYKQLPTGKSLLYEAMRMGKAVKVIVAFRSAFWKDEIPPKEGHDSSSSSVIAYPSPISNLFETKVLSDPGLVGLITGPYAEAFSRVEDADTRRKMILAQLSVMYGYTESAHGTPTFYVEKDWTLENFSGGCFAGIYPPTADSIFARLGLGFSFSSSEDDRSDALSSDHTKNISLAIGDRCGNFHFACTESSPVFYGYMEGAVRAGNRVAREILGDFESA